MIDPAFLDVPSWRTVDPKLWGAKMKKEVPKGPVAIWTINRDIAPVDLYVYLRARFGPPNGFQMQLKSPSSDNLVHWHWSLQYLDRLIEFMGSTMHARVFAEASGDPGESDTDSLVASLKADFVNHTTGMCEERARLERWTVFINPYCRLERVVKRFTERLAEIDLANVELPRMPRTHEELASFQASFDHAITAHTEALGITTSLRMLAPVLAESFINLVLFVLVRPDTRKDQRLYDSLFRTDVDVRVRGLHLHCLGFTKPVDVADQRFKSFQSLMQHRNDFLHGNVKPAALAYREVYFDGVIPLPKRYESMPELALVNSLRHVEPERALADLAVVTEFVVLILQALSDEACPLVLHFMETLDPGWNEDEQRPAILFPATLAFTLMGDHSPREGSSPPDAPPA